MTRIGCIVTLASLAAANHLSGPLQDRLTACQVQYCPAFDAALKADNYANLGAGSFNSLIQPPLNGVSWVHNLSFALRFMGYVMEDFEYKKEAGGEMMTGRATQNMTQHFLDCAQQCMDLMEPIFQPIGRSFMQVISGGTMHMPCQTEFDACMAANPDPAGVSTGSVATHDHVFANVHPNASSSVCQPEKALLAYKVAYNLTADCAAGDTTLGGGGATALALARCLQGSRARGGQGLADPTDIAVYYNCLDIGGPDCGEAYTCSGVPTTGVPTTTAAGSSSEADCSVKVAGVLGMMVSTLGLFAY